jgi:hypothetical protein
MKYDWQEINCEYSPLSRSSHSVSAIGNKVYCIGGEHEARIPIDMVVYELDMDSNPISWKAVHTEGDNAPSPRIAHGQAVIGNCVWIFGGRNGVQIGEGPRNDLYCFDTTTMLWTGPISGSSDVIPPARSFHKMVSVGEVLYVFGGCASEGRLSDLYSFDTASLAWTQLACSSDISGRGGPGFVALPALQSLVVSTGYSGQENNDIHIYHIPTDQWTQLAATGSDLFRARSVCPVAGLDGRFMVLFGGEVSTSDRGHEGAGDFARDVVCLDCSEPSSSCVLQMEVLDAEAAAPLARGWTEMATLSSSDDGMYALRCVCVSYFNLSRLLEYSLLPSYYYRLLEGDLVRRAER